MADGEIEVRGPGVFGGYLGADGPGGDAGRFVPTGDLGTLDADGFLVLKGRKSELFKTSTGRKIAPLEVEAALRRLPGIDQAVLVGAGRKAPVAILTLGATQEMPALTHLMEVLARALPERLAGLPAWTRPVGLVILTRSFSIDRGELTSNLKLRRTAIETGQAAALDALWADLHAGTPFQKVAPEGWALMSCEPPA